MIPTLILFGLIFGRWWRSALVTGVVGWVLLTVLLDLTGWDQVLATALLALVNTAVGVGIHQAILWLAMISWRARSRH